MGRASTPPDTSVVREVGGYSVRISRAPDDPDWDDFLESTPMGNHAQASCWGRARASIGWKPIRVVVSADGRVVAGVQMLTRPLPATGDAGFVFRGPVIPDGQPELAELVFDEMMALGKTNDVQYLVVQPPRGGDWMLDKLARLGLRLGAFDIQHASTVCIDLQPDVDQLLKNLSRQRRQNVRTAEKGGINVRRGTEADLPTFNRLKDLHSARLGYSRRDEGYYTELWHALAPRGNAVLFVAEYEGEPVSALLALPFGVNCTHLERPWSGEHGELRPNELLEWEVIKWAKSEGYRFTDLGGLPDVIAEAIRSGQEVPRDPQYSAPLFKLKWGGEVVVDPHSYDYVYNPLLRFGYRCIPHRVKTSEWMRGLVSKSDQTGS